MLASSLREDGFADQGEWSPLDTGPSRADSFEYVMHGKIYRCQENTFNKSWRGRHRLDLISLAELRVMRRAREPAVSLHMFPLAASS